MQRKALCCLFVMAFALAACNLSAARPTPTLAPATSFPQFIPTPTIFSSLGGTPAATNAPVEGLNPNCPLPPGWTVYTVEAGDSMGLIAQQTDSSIAELTQGNCLSNADELYVGQALYVPRTPVVS